MESVTIEDVLKRLRANYDSKIDERILNVYQLGSRVSLNIHATIAFEFDLRRVHIKIQGIWYCWATERLGLYGLYIRMILGCNSSVGNCKTLRFHSQANSARKRLHKERSR